MPKIVLTKNQWARISEILGNFGLLTIGIIVVPAILEKSSILLAILGVVMTALFWYASIATAKKY